MTRASIKSVAGGTGGAIVLALFFTTFLTVDKVVFIMPLFLAFTGAMTGYQLVDTLRQGIRGRFLFPFAMGAGQGAVVFILVAFMGPLAGSLAAMTLADLAVYILVSGITSYLGARLAARYFNL